MDKLRIDNIREFKQIMAHEPYHGRPNLPISQEKDFEELYQYFKGKKVAIVSPSDILMGKKLGELIDSYDIVCKSGDSHLIKDYNDYGEKVDCLFSGCFPNWGGKKIHEPENFKNKNIKKIICPIKPCMDGILDVHKRNIYGHYKYLEKELPEIDFYSIGILSCLFDNQAKTRATSGTFAINFLLHQDLEELGIFGFTWYQNSGYHPQYTHQCKGSHGFSFELEKKLLKKKIDQSKFKIKLYHTSL